MKYLPISVAMVMLWNYLGPASLAGFAMLVFLIVLNLFLAAKVKKLQAATMKLKDKRTKQTNEILNGVKVTTETSLFSVLQCSKKNRNFPLRNRARNLFLE